jgi:DNA-binding IclR family transcriptional regulator
VLASIDSEGLNDYLERHRLHELTSRTITNQQTLARSLELVRLTGLAVDDEEYLPGNACIAVPLTTNGTVGAVAVSLPRTRLDELDTIQPLLEHTAQRIARSYALAAES